ncbi:MAG: 1,4-alpha-glucan branching protein GlgB [Evtepia sp.]
MDDFCTSFLSGQEYQAYHTLGALPYASGYKFTVYAPNALYVAVVGDFNHWDSHAHPMQKNSQGFWTCFVAPLEKGEIYKYFIIAADFNVFFKSDPFAFKSEGRPKTASVTWDLDFQWKDAQWMETRRNGLETPMPLNIYEVHLGSWRKKGKDENDFYTYREIAPILVPYLKEMGYTHVEFMPLAEHPFDGSWGYQGTGYFSLTSRYGNPEEFMYLIEYCHENQIGVIMDWVPGHFCKDIHGLCRFDGSKLYEGGEHSQWGTYRFDFSKPLVWSFLISNAFFWFDLFHVDGIRADGVTSMLYTDFGERNATNLIDQNAVKFLQTLNGAVGKRFPEVMMIAEESSPYPLITYPPEVGGLGFHYKWNMGWMNDTLHYAETAFEFRSELHHLLNFSMMYAFSENFILPLSHDEVVHGKKSLIGRMPGDYEQKFAGIKVLMAYQMVHPGAKLSFMGNEFAQFIEWNYTEELEWFLLEYDKHKAFQTFVRDINHMYQREPCLWKEDRKWSGFRWLDADDRKQSILIFERWAGTDCITVMLNFGLGSYPQFRVGVENAGRYYALCNSNRADYGGTDTNEAMYTADPIARHGKKYSVETPLPPLTCLILKRVEGNAYVICKQGTI